MSGKGVMLLAIILLVTLSSANAIDISLDPCGNPNSYELGNEVILENNCIRLEMLKVVYDPDIEIYDKINNRYFSLTANQIVERNNAGAGTSTTTLTSLKLNPDITGNNLIWSNANGVMFGYELIGREFKLIGNLTGWNYDYADSNLWLDMKFHKNDGDLLTWIPVIVDGVEQPIITENRTAGQNNFILQKLGRGNEIIIDPTIILDYEPDPASIYENGDRTAQTYSTFDSPIDVTATISDNNTNTYVNILNTYGVLDTVLRLRWNNTYDNQSQYFLRYYQTNAGLYSIIIYYHMDDNNINTTNPETYTSTGVGWHNINITDATAYTTNVLGRNVTEMRMTTVTTSTMNIGEVRLRVETTDDTPPTINSYFTTDANITCFENSTFTANVTDNMDVNNVTLKINGQNYTTTKNLDEYSATITPPTTNGTTIYTLETIYAYDLFGNLATNTTTTTINYTCSYEEYINITHTSTQGIDLIVETNNATIKWTTSNPSDSRVNYGLSPSNLTNTEYESSNVTQHEITLTGLTNSTTYYYEVISTYNPNQTLGVFNFTTLCVENWIINITDNEECQTDNTINQLTTYNDANSCGTINDLPIDNGTSQDNYCNYCDPDWINLGTCLQNSSILNQYFDYNYCYQITNLSEDEPPITDGTWTSCQYYNNDFDCMISSVPYMREKIEYTCTLPNGNYECINTISYGLDDILQVNPQKSEKTTGLINIRSDTESREYFTASKGLLNAYFTPKNLVADNNFTITTMCSDDNNTLIHQQTIRPTLKNLDTTNTGLIWLKNNIAYLFILLLLLMLGAMIVGSVIRHMKG